MSVQSIMRSAGTGLCLTLIMQLGIAADSHNDNLRHPTPAEIECAKNELALAKCTKANADSQEDVLEKVRAEVQAALLPEQRETFQNAELAWDRYLELSCDFDASLASGSSKDTRSNSCLEFQTKQRVDLLSAYLKCISQGSCGSDVRLYRLEARTHSTK